MTQDEYNAKLQSDEIKIEPTEPVDSSAASSLEKPMLPLEQFLPILVALQGTQRCLSVAPAFIPQTFQDQIQFVFDGVNTSVYFYFNNQWNLVSGVTGVNALAAGFGISISASTGTVTISCTIDDATIPTSDITTNNVSISKHGWTPKLPNDAGKFLNGVGAWATPSGGGGSASYANGSNNTRFIDDVGGTQTIAHGLGTTPKVVRISAVWGVGTPSLSQSWGTYNGTTGACMYSTFTVGSGMNYGSTTTYQIYLQSVAGDGQAGTITVDATNISIAWTKLGSGSHIGINMAWEANT